MYNVHNFMYYIVFMINTNTESIHCKVDKKSNMLMYSAALLLNCQRENFALKNIIKICRLEGCVKLYEKLYLCFKFTVCPLILFAFTLNVFSSSKLKFCLLHCVNK